MIDAQGFRPNVGIVLCNPAGKVFWGRRIGQDSWQFPQGGIRRDERPDIALFRELWEEVGLDRSDVAVLGRTQGWLRYRIPRRYLRRGRPVCIGQKQIWYLLRLTGSEERIQFDRTGLPEFDGFQWVDYWAPLDQIVNFKRGVYRRALRELEQPYQAALGEPPAGQPEGVTCR